MEKNMTFQGVFALQEGLRPMLNSVRKPAEVLRKYYSDVLGRDLNLRQTWSLLEAQLAFAAAVFPIESPLLLRALCCGWFLHAVLRCRERL